MFEGRASSHNYETRSRNTIRPAIPNRASSSNIIRFFIPSLVSETDDCIIDKITTHSYNGFSRYIKHNFIDAYEETCTILNCYVCGRSSQ